MTERAGVGDVGDVGRVLVILPTYNEAENLGSLVARIRAALPQADLLVADDSSPDGTGAVAEELARADDHVQVLHRPRKEGLGAAYRAGFRWGLQRCYDVLVEMDADGSHRPEELPRLLAALPDADLVIGSRWTPGGRVVDWPAFRQALSRGGNTYARIVLGLPVRDATGGYRAFRRATLEGIGLSGVASQGYCFQVDVAWRAVHAGYRVVEVPITFVERERGVSKMNPGIVAEALWRVTMWGVTRRLAQLRERKAT
ncbi:MAG: polyprenol monophosphomannose synthase [Streptomycetales bacterium]